MKKHYYISLFFVFIGIISNAQPILDYNNNNSISISQNSTGGSFEILTDNLEKVEVFNIHGQVILKTNQNKINIEKQPAGLFFIRISTDGQTITKKIIKE
ncbi:MAG: T9SS type A sorting domain-containing protein [Bacteroidota bacterium]|nr:T9SS type A sorting domain-containing protein [Bacteroidota bacterium]